VPISRAIAASSASPGLVEPISIGDRRYMDGGVTGVNVDGAAEYDIVVVITTTVSASRRQEVARFRAEHQARVVHIEPSSEFAPVLNDLPASARAGVQHAGLIVDDVRSVWNG
jgi:NTE family protein